MTLEQRIEKLERQNRTLKLAVASMLLAGVGALIMGQATTGGTDVANLIRAHRIEIVSADGKPAVVLGMTAGGTGTVTTLDAKENKIVSLGVTKNGEGTITTGNSRGRDLVRIAVTTEGEGVLITNNADGKKLVEIGVTTEGDPKIYTFKPDGSTKAQWP
ncbi:MAG TPA: hypothetical protein PL151_10115 [Phycisphaerae bacterium]|nr:hypothetical protein [Phycisphaerae bacterium]HOJ73895.1 hypothetical protein [Phycisphaerae bacterium]HOM50836.1 hypothetical protein [Phycisphaerae bacterium]HON67970.1 hypothetical protein [Phycisphaerae bacterium]HOQ86774.1 hypothetical protein [Phycisphaerae bacterium]